MKKFLIGVISSAIAFAVPVLATAGVNVGISIGIPLPPPIVFGAPPVVVVLPDTPDVYVAPDVNVDIFFWNGWWWQPWEGRWYRSHYYDRGWAYYDNVPRFYYDVDPGWRGYYREHNWYGHPWNYERIPSRQLQQNWKTWHNERYWEGQRTWGVQNYQPRSNQQRQEQRHQRQIQYQRKAEVQLHQQRMKEVREQQRHGQPGVYQHSQQRERKPQESRSKQNEGRHE
jgi:hypothetical protein